MEPEWLDHQLIEDFHKELCGTVGLRDRGLLESALAAPRNRAAYDDPDLCELAACYGVGIVRNHPFVDGNKRMAYVAVGIFLADNGMELCADKSYVLPALRSIATGEMSEKEFAGWLRRFTRRRRRKPSKAAGRLLARYHR